MSAHQELAEIIQDCGEYIPGSHADDYVNPDKAATAILAAGYRKPRTITTADEVEALFDSDANAVLMDEDGIVLQNLAGGWGSPSFNNDLLSSRDLHRMFGPTFTVISERTA